MARTIRNRSEDNYRERRKVKAERKRQKNSRRDRKYTRTV